MDSIAYMTFGNKKKYKVSDPAHLFVVHFETKLVCRENCVEHFLY